MYSAWNVLLKERGRTEDEHTDIRRSHVEALMLSLFDMEAKLRNVSIEKAQANVAPHVVAAMQRYLTLAREHTPTNFNPVDHITAADAPRCKAFVEEYLL